MKIPDIAVSMPHLDVTPAGAGKALWKGVKVGFWHGATTGLLVAIDYWTNILNERSTQELGAIYISANMILVFLKNWITTHKAKEAGTVEVAPIPETTPEPTA